MSTDSILRRPRRDIFIFHALHTPKPTPMNTTSQHSSLQTLHYACSLNAEIGFYGPVVAYVSYVRLRAQLVLVFCELSSGKGRGEGSNLCSHVTAKPPPQHWNQNDHFKLAVLKIYWVHSHAPRHYSGGFSTTVFDIKQQPESILNFNQYFFKLAFFRAPL